jgi:hypothetical protein
MHSGPFGCLTKLCAKHAEVVQKFVPWSCVGIFRNERTRSTLLDPYVMFRFISYYLGAFGTVCCVTTLSSKRAKLVQKFVPRSHVGIFRNERIRSTPLDSKLMFWCVSYYLFAFGTVWWPYKTRGKTGRSGAKVRAMKSCRNFSQQTTRTIWVHLVLFGCLTKLCAKRDEVVQKFVPWRRVIIFRNERIQSTPLDPKLMFWCVSYYLYAFGTIWLPYKTLCKTGRSGAKVRAMKSHRNFSQRTHPIHPIGL